MLTIAITNGRRKICFVTALKQVRNKDRKIGGKRGKNNKGKKRGIKKKRSRLPVPNVVLL